MAKALRCLVGRHDWAKFESAQGEVGAECRRCGQLDWHHFDPIYMSSKWRIPGGAG
jgi:tRNA U38,U39,U40 pseudouridine synthase TruA